MELDHLFVKSNFWAKNVVELDDLLVYALKILIGDFLSLIRLYYIKIRNAKPIEDQTSS